jgi:hypothetical protein
VKIPTLPSLPVPSDLDSAPELLPWERSNTCLTLDDLLQSEMRFSVFSCQHRSRKNKNVQVADLSSVTVVGVDTSDKLARNRPRVHHLNVASILCFAVAAAAIELVKVVHVERG